MRSERLSKGQMRQGKTPDWGPLERLLRSHDLCAHFMWMFDVELEDGTILNAYKHRWTRCYFHLADDGRTFVFVPEHSYREIDPRVAIRDVLADRGAFECTKEEKAAIRQAQRRSRLASN